MIFGRRRINVQTWANQWNVCAILPPDVTPIFLKPGEEELLHAFSELCHAEVEDRSTEFTLHHRKKLYRKWLSSGLPCLMMLVDSESNALVSSILLPLKAEAFREFWYEGLDALDIDRSHLLATGEKPPRQYLLVDMLARHRDYIDTLSMERQTTLRGIGFRALTRHMAEFSPVNVGFQPVLLCSTLGPKLRKVLTSIGFEEKSGQTEHVPIYRADFGRDDWYSDGSRWLIRSVLSNVAFYAAQLAQQSKEG